MPALKDWPTPVWIVAGSMVLLLLHAIGLGVQLVLVQTSGGMPPTPDAPIRPIVASYVGQALGGFIPMLAVLILGLYAARFLQRHYVGELAALGTTLTYGLLGMGIFIAGLAFPIWGGP